MMLSSANSANREMNYSQRCPGLTRLIPSASGATCHLDVLDHETALLVQRGVV